MFINFPATANIAVTTQPTKTSYVAGESFDPTGMVVEMTVDGQSEEVSGYTYSPSGALTTSDNTITISYLGMTTTVSVTVSEQQATETLEIVNESSEDVEIYYEDDKEEYGNTTVSAGSSQTISIDTQYPYYIRYSEGGSDNRHNFEGTYQGVSGYNTEVYYYDGKICPPQEVSKTEWTFYSGDSGTLLIRDAK